MTESINDTLSLQRSFRRFAFTAPYWEATREKKLKLQYSPATGAYQFPPHPIDVKTGSCNLEWREVSGRGTVKTYTVIRKAFGPFAGLEPYVVVMATLTEGVDVIADLVACTFEEIRIGMTVEPYWMPMPDGEHLLMFKPEGAADPA